MADCRMFGQNKNYLNHSSVNGLLLFIYTMAQLFAPQSCTLETASNNTSCGAESTCIKCTIRPQCSWFLPNMGCINKTNVNYSSIHVHTKEECPRFSVVTEYDYNDKISSLKYNVKVSNESVSFMNFLNQSNFTCNATRIDKSEMKIDDMLCSTRIKLNAVSDSSRAHVKPLLAAFLFYVRYNPVILQLGNITKPYETIYDHQCVEDSMNDHCGTCTLNNDDFTRSVRLCSCQTSCEGPKELYLNHHYTQQFWNFSSQKFNDSRVEINLTFVDPLSGTMAGGTNITITVKNHWKYAMTRNFTVTVAGTLCANLSMSGPETITCITTPPPNDAREPPSGPVLVKYTSQNGHVMHAESSQKFQFEVGSKCGAPRPVLDSNQTLYGLENGGNTLKLYGYRFTKPCAASQARMFVKLPNGSMQFSSSYCDTPVNDTYIVCRAPQLNSSNVWDVNKPNFTRALNFGLEMMNFVGNQSLFVNGSLISFYHIIKKPVLKYFDIEEGGSVVVYGNHLRYIGSDDVLIRFKRSQDTNCKVTSATELSFVCMPNTAVVVSEEMFVKIYNVLTYNITKRPYDYFKLFWYCIVTLLIIIVLALALACFYKINRRSKVRKTVRCPSVHLKDLDTHTALL